MRDVAAAAASAPPAAAPPAAGGPGESAGADTGAPGDGEQRDPDFVPLRAAPLEPLVRRLMRERYGGAPRERRRDVARQLAAAQAWLAAHPDEAAEIVA